MAGKIAIIPARGGSKRIPRKNIVDFCGKPMIAWTIEAAIQSRLFDHVLVSTDDEEIAVIARDRGAEAPFLRHEANDDFAPVSVATLRALDQAEAYWGERFEYVAQLMANCPLRATADILISWQNFVSRGASYQISCFEYGFMNPWWAHTLDGEGKPLPLFTHALTQRSQDLPKLYCPTGAIWLAAVEALRFSKTFYGPGHLFYPIDWKAAIDIDDEADLTLAAAIHNMGELMG